uniref:ADAM metallopeptidase with thrombospondin type 1 motif 7 n=1 Tax=Scleropages formosus TaxID=113540 RepID=A0A8C9REA8_SCLFO
MLEKDKTFGQVDDQGSESLLQGLLEYEVVHPSRVDPAGHFVSNLVSHRVNRVQRRDTSRTGASLAQVFYHLQLRGQDLLFNLTLNHHLLAPGFLTERRYGGLEGAKIRAHGHSLCHFLGEVWGSPSTWGQAAISTCDGLTGLFKLSQEEFFIRPLEQVSEEGQPQAHVVYKRHTEQPRDPLLRPLSAGSKVNGTCGVEEWQRERWEQRQQRRRVRPRSVSREKWVETLVVADPKMVEYHGSQGVESYALAIMNIVAGLFRDASIGNSINIMVVRLILLEQDEADLKISHHADHSLSSFCKWQKRLNVKGDENPVHHDVAVLLTRKDICAAINKPCETLGLSHVSGMCQPHRSCSISEDTGLPLAFTVAHELGHNFGIQHDGNGNDCEPIGKRPFIMSPQLLYGSAPPNWSRCSRQYITRFLDRGWGWCLDDIPSSKDLALRSLPPGVLYTAAHQCRLQYGSGSLLCDDVDNVCSTLWCTVGNTCHSKLDGAVDGTKCGENKAGICLSRPIVLLLAAVCEGFITFPFHSCPRPAGFGPLATEGTCQSAVFPLSFSPVHGGKYCLGERRRYRICNNAPCPSDEPPFRLVQCSRFNTMPYKGKFYKWVQVNNRVNPCELHCRPLNEHFSEKMLDAVIDGTQCYEGTSSRDICINGICKSVGCDYKIDSNAVEDRCGVCHGNGSTCETVKKTFEETEGLGYVDIGLIPEGARDIRIEEVAEAGNFLALRSSDPNKYFLNGGWTIQWNGDYKAAGTVFTYERTGHLENLTSPGPTLEPVWIQLLFQETNPGVRYEYTISRENLVESDNDTVPEFQWRYGSWTDCSATCGTGVQRQIVHCMERTSGIVEEHYCDPATRPDDKRASCNEELCPATWWVGEWQKCSSSCGESGLAKRTVLCIQSVGLEEQRALHPSECQHMPRPDSVVPCNRHLLCPSNWTVGNWSQCSVTCGSGLQSRTVVCSNNTGAACDPRMRPKSDLSCYIQDCPVTVDIFGSDWSGSGSSSREIFNDINSVLDDNHLPIPEKGTARIHPTRHRGDHNNVFEEDLSHSNHIDNTADNSIRNKVLVDDFYYDYNFIRFHEDLSYDFDDKVDTGDSLGFDQKEEPKPASLGSTTDLPTTTSYTLVTSSKNTHNGRALPPGADNDQLITADVEELENIKVQDQLPAGNPGKGNGESLGLCSEDRTQLVSREDLGDLAVNTATTSSILNTASSLSTTLAPDVSTTVEKTAPEGPWPHPSWPKINFSEVYVPPMLRPGGSDHPLPEQSGNSPGGAGPNRPVLSYTAQPDPTAFWTTGNWSTVSYTSNPHCCPSVQCSTSCGLGATWRSVRCSTGADSDCAASKRPVPARRCYLRPCSTWRAGVWSKCSRNCGGGVKHREIQCFDVRDQRPLRPFHCQAVAPGPPTRALCSLQACMDWYASSWGQCSEVCGGGEQQRLVTCAEPGKCEESLRPNRIQTCNSQPCAQWVTGFWGQCSASCGGGVRRRLVKCVDVRAEPEGTPEEDPAQCDHTAWPENTEKCETCLRDRLTFRFCQTLQWLGRCHLPTVRAQCCRTCGQMSRGNERSSRR